MGKSSRKHDTEGQASILHLVKQVQYRAFVRLESVFQPLGVTAVQFRILTTLASSPGLSSAELARLYDVKPQTMIKQIALLEAKGLIERRVSCANRRLLELSLTPSGQSTLDRCRTDSRALEARILEVLSPKEQEAMRASMTRLLESLIAPAGASEELDGEEFTQEYRRAGVQRV